MDEGRRILILLKIGVFMTLSILLGELILRMFEQEEPEHSRVRFRKTYRKHLIIFASILLYLFYKTLTWNQINMIIK